MMHKTHPYIPLYKQAFQVMMAKSPEEQKRVVVKLHMKKNADGHRSIYQLLMKSLPLYLAMVQRDLITMTLFSTL
jgi:hypothetical protein